MSHCNTLFNLWKKDSLSIKDTRNVPLYSVLSYLWIKDSLPIKDNLPIKDTRDVPL